MFLRKELKKKTLRYHKLNFSNFAHGMNSEVDENILPHKFAKLLYNFSVKRGSLENGLGVQKLRLPKSLATKNVEFDILIPPAVKQIHKLWMFPYYQNFSNKRLNYVLVYTNDGFYWLRTENEISTLTKEVTTFQFNEIPNGTHYNIDGSDVMIFASGVDSMAVISPDFTAAVYPNAPKIVSMCKHYERLFAIEKGRGHKLIFSANLNPANWEVSQNAGGYIELFDERGSIIKIVSFNDFVYLFRERGITRLSAYGDQEEFSLSHLYLTSDKLYGNSVCVCGDRIMFLAENGIYSFDGYNVRKISLNIESLLKDVANKNCAASYFNGKYYLACRLNFGDNEFVGCEKTEGYVNNTLLEFDLRTSEFNILRGIDVKDMCYAESEVVSKLILCFNGEHCNKLGQLTTDGMIFSNILPKVWKSSYSNLGFPGKTKIIKEVSILSKADCEVRIKTDKQEEILKIEGANKTSVIPTNIRGEMLEIEFRSESAENYISGPQITLGVV